jgi:predicted deacylase
MGRIIGNRSDSDGPTVVFIGGIHGNEPAGVLALHQVFQQLEDKQIEIRGRILGLAGNVSALAQQKRFLSKDLNRIWDSRFATRFRSRENQTQDRENNGQVVEFREQEELFEIIEPLLKLDSPVYFLDLHTTSSASVPFIAINDQLSNREFAFRFTVKTVLGIEEYLDGPLLSFLNDFGHVALAFEAGQHDDPKSVELHISFIYLALLAAGVIDKPSVARLSRNQECVRLSEGKERDIFEVIFRRSITHEDGFQMKPGFQNFDPITKGELLAEDHRGPIISPRGGHIFMPLYQSSGTDGFFVVRRVPRWALSISSILRKIRFDDFLTLLPGISRSSEYTDALVVNRKVAFWLATELFHLLGFRRKKAEGDTLIFSRREIE